MSRLKTILRTAAGALLAAVALLGVIWLAGCRVLIEPRHGWATETVMSFAAGAASPTLVQDFAAGAEARNLVILIGDGMGFGHLAGARAALAGINGRLFVERLPVTGWLTTHSADRLLTDSAAGATALATGHKTDMKRLATSAAGEPLRTLMEAAAERGKAIGLVTDSYLWDATPAAFATHVDERQDHRAVAVQMAASGFDLFLGEEDDLNGDEGLGAVLETFRAHGFRVARDIGALPAADDGGPVLGLFAEGSVHDPERPPELPQLAAYALERLARDDDGFVLLLETEETDTASHRHGFERMVRGVAALDRVVEAAAGFARRDRHTLIVVTADHDTGGLTLLHGRDGGPLRVHWSSWGHTGNPVPLFAYGPGAARLGGVHDNVEVPRILAGLLGLDLD